MSDLTDRIRRDQQDPTDHITAIMVSRDRLATIPSYDVTRLSERILALTTQRENLRECLADVLDERHISGNLRKRIADLLEST